MVSVLRQRRMIFILLDKCFKSTMKQISAALSKSIWSNWTFSWKNHHNVGIQPEYSYKRTDQFHCQLHVLIQTYGNTVFKRSNCTWDLYWYLIIEEYYMEMAKKSFRTSQTNHAIRHKISTHTQKTTTDR